MKHGFTLIEILIVVSIVSILVTLGVSAYGKARERQVGQNALELIISTLQSNQTIASIGKKDCSGKFMGQVIDISTPNSISAHALCQGGSGQIITTAVPGVTFSNNSSFTFNPLSYGINLGQGTTQLTISFTSTAQLVYQIKLTSSGTIESLGIQ